MYIRCTECGRDVEVMPDRLNIAQRLIARGYSEKYAHKVAWRAEIPNAPLATRCPCCLSGCITYSNGPCDRTLAEYLAGPDL